MKKVDEKKVFLKEKAEFYEKFYRLMFELGLYNKFNRTYNLKIIEKTNYGYKAYLNLEPGLFFSEFQKKIGEIQQGLCCIWIMKMQPFKDYANIKIVTQALDEETPYENPQIKPWQMYLGLDFSLEPIKNNCNDYCMFLLAGATGAGKTRFLYLIILSWILSCKINEVEIYLADPVKDGFSKFRNAKMVKYYATEIESILSILKYMEIKLSKRKSVIGKLREAGLATNIVEYNSISKSKMSYCYVVIDEFSFLIPDKSDNETEKTQKQEIIDICKKLSKAGREMGIFLLVGVQKTVKDELPSLIKNMAAVRISFRANDSISSEVIMGDNCAVGLMDRYAVYSQNGGEKRDYLFSPLLTTQMLNNFLQPPYSDPNHKKIDIDSIIKDTETKQPPAKVTKVVNLPKKQRNKNSHYPVVNLIEEDQYVDN